MKLTITLMLFAVIAATAGSTYSQTARINLKMTNATMVDVFREIERTSDFGFFFKSEEMDLDQRISVNLQNVSIQEILKKILMDNYDYRILEKNIVVTRGSFNTTQVKQGKSVSGNVTDSSGASLPGVSVVVKGTTNGTITDRNGNYSITNVPENATIQFSFVGMEAQEVAVTRKSTVNVKMEEVNIGIEEVVAIGYGATTKRDITGAISSMKSENIETSVINNVGEALSGRLAGVHVSTPSGAPGGGVNIQIRGINSINGSSEPLYVVDNFVGVDPKTIDPSEISNIEVLKDASATAIYGSLGANGVIIITTNNLSKKGKSEINFSATTGLNEVISQFDMLNGKDYYRMLPLKVPFKDTFRLWAEQYKDVEGINWQDEALRKALYQTYRFSANGSNGDSKYYSSFSYTDEPGILINTGYDKLTMNLLGEHRFNKTVAIKSGFDYSRQENSGLSSSGQYGAYYTLLQQRPHFGTYDLLNSDFFYDENGVPIDGGVNPISNLKNAQNSTVNETFRGNIEMIFNITPSLKFISKVAKQWGLMNGEQFYNSKTLTGSYKKGVATLL